MLVNPEPSPKNLNAVTIPVVLALKLEESMDCNETLLEPLNDTELASTSPEIEKFFAFCSVVAVSALPVRSP